MEETIFYDKSQLNSLSVHFSLFSDECLMSVDIFKRCLPNNNRIILYDNLDSCLRYLFGQTTTTKTEHIYHKIKSFRTWARFGICSMIYEFYFTLQIVKTTHVLTFKVCKCDYQKNRIKSIKFPSKKQHTKIAAWGNGERKNQGDLVHS